MHKSPLVYFLALLAAIALACNLPQAENGKRKVLIDNITVVPSKASPEQYTAVVEISPHDVGDTLQCYLSNAGNKTLVFTQAVPAGSQTNLLDFSFIPAGPGENSLGCTATNSGSAWSEEFNVESAETPTGQFTATPLLTDTLAPSLQSQSLNDLLKSGTYKVLVTWPNGSSNSTWTLTVNGGQVTGSSQWTCCPGPRTDPLTGTLNAGTITVERDCTGQGWTQGACHQTFTGSLQNGVITGGIAGTSIVQGEVWTLYLK